MLLALTGGTTRPSCSSTKVLKLGVTVLELALLHLREKVAQLDIFFPFRRKRVVVLPTLVGLRLRAFEHGVDGGVVDVVLHERAGVAPFRHDDELGIVLQIRRFLRLEVAYAERRQPATQAGR